MPKAKKGGVAKIADYRKTNEATAQDRVVCLSIDFRTYGTSRALDLTKVEMEADPDRVHATKSIMKSPNLAEIDSLWGKAHRWLGTKCLPGPLRKGVYSCPNELVVEVTEKMKQFEQDAQPAIKRLVAELPEIKRRDKAALRNQYQERDYPTAAELEAAFYIFVQPFDFSIPKGKLPPALYARSVAQSRKSWDESLEQARELLRATGKVVIERMAKQLETDKDGKRKPVLDATVNNVKKFLKDFEVRNIADDDKMLYLVSKAKGLLDGVNADDLRYDEGVRDKVATELDKINADVAGLMKRPLRAIELA